MNDEQTRSDFEQAAMSGHIVRFMENRADLLKRRADGDYIYADTHNAWLTWHAAAKHYAGVDVLRDSVRLLISRIGCGCGGDYGTCNHCDKAISDAEAIIGSSEQ